MVSKLFKGAALGVLTVAFLAGCGASNPTQPNKQPLSKEALAKAVVINSTTPYRKGVSVPAAVQRECTLQTQLPDFIESYAEKAGVAVASVNSASSKKGRVLDMEIIHIVGSGGGAWSGAKSVSVEGKLYTDGKLTGTFTATRHSGGGLFGGYKGTCSILGRCVKALGQDISRWLESPYMDARLGDA
ncbi:hypothetical protein [Thiohalomonas denitrificans]|uniref:hypothetical protein n=1 Tax=Thiohalomonas denitrificans TaxID=415747 RepID=UPI0026EFC5B6|nr:hypothetical protein [Thiohalomonas denitrificans]